MLLRKARLVNRKRRDFPLKSKSKAKSSLPSLDDFLEQRDYNGASTILNFQSPSSSSSSSSSLSSLSEVDRLLWRAFCSFHNRDYAKAQEYYIELLTGDSYDNVPDETMLYLALTYYHMQMHEEAQESVEKGPDCGLKDRIKFHLAHKLYQDEEAYDEMIVELRQKLKDGLGDQLSKGSMLYAQGLYQDATDCFKQLMMDHRDNVAFNVYVAMCYFKMDYYDVSQETLSVYEQMHSDSVVAKNLRACNNFRLYDGNAAIDELKKLDMLDENLLLENDLLRHNMVVFTDGEMALQNLPPLLDSIPEAKLNLAIYHLRNNDFEEADATMEDCEPCTTQELIVKGVVKALLGQMQGQLDLKMMREAQSYFQSVGKSPTETDTIPGRQCMASALFLRNDFEDANVYLSSIQTYLGDDDDFNWNYGISLAAAGDYVTAEETLLKVNDPSYKGEIHYCTWLARCIIMNGHAAKAWEMHHSIDQEHKIDFLKVIADDCFRSKQFPVAAKAFDALKDFDDDYDYSQGLKSACTAVFRSVVVEKCFEKEVSKTSQVNLLEVVDILQHQVDGDADFKRILNTLKQWMRKNKLS